MRAKMSDRGLRCPAAHGDCDRGSDYAVREARAILRESEPQHHDWNARTLCFEHTSCGQHAQLDPLRASHTALADSLRAFVDQPAEQLGEWLAQQRSDRESFEHAERIVGLVERKS